MCHWSIAHAIVMDIDWDYTMAWFRLVQRRCMYGSFTPGHLSHHCSHIFAKYQNLMYCLRYSGCKIHWYHILLTCLISITYDILHDNIYSTDTLAIYNRWIWIQTKKRLSLKPKTYDENRNSNIHTRGSSQRNLQGPWLRLSSWQGSLHGLWLLVISRGWGSQFLAPFSKGLCYSRMICWQVGQLMKHRSLAYYSVDQVGITCKNIHWWKLKVFKILNFQTLILKLAVCPLNNHSFKFKWSIVLRQTEN